MIISHFPNGVATAALVKNHFKIYAKIAIAYEPARMEKQKQFSCREPTKRRKSKIIMQICIWMHRVRNGEWYCISHPLSLCVVGFRVCTTHHAYHTATARHEKLQTAKWKCINFSRECAAKVLAPAAAAAASNGESRVNGGVDPNVNCTLLPKEDW